MPERYLHVRRTRERTHRLRGANLRSRLLRHRRTEPPCRSRRNRRKQNQLRPAAGNPVPLHPAGQRFGFGTRQRTGFRRTAGNTSRFDPPGRGTRDAHHGQRPDEPPLPVDHAKKAGALLGNRTRRGTRGVRRRGVDPRRPFRLSETGPGAGRRLGRVVGIPHRIAASAGSHRRPTDTAGRASLRNRTIAAHEHRICFRTPGGIPHLY